MPGTKYFSRGREQQRRLASILQRGRGVSPLFFDSDTDTAATKTASYVQPRRTKRISRIGTGIPISQRSPQPKAPDSLSKFLLFIPSDRNQRGKCVCPDPSPSPSLFAAMIEAKDLMERLPGRVDQIVGLVATNK